MAVDVVLAGISKYFGNNHVVRDVNLLFPELKFITLLGPSGCGKTTLLRMIAGLESISSGDINFGDRRINNVRPGERDVAMVFQNYALYPNMNVFNNIGYGLRVRNISKQQIREKVNEVAGILEISHLLDRKPKHLSGGQRQRVALGRAMVRNPLVFLMDEPLSNLDAKLRVNMRSELKHFHKRLGTTTIYVTHDQLEAMTMSDLIAVMHDGVVQQFGTPEVIYNEPQNLFVAGFIGSPPMNFLNVKSAGKANEEVLIGEEKLILPEQIRTKFKGIKPGREITMGIRPQEVLVGAQDESGGLNGIVDMIELLGSEKLIDIRLPDGQKIVAQVRADYQIGIGDKVIASPGLASLHLFDTATGESLRHVREAD